MAEIRNLALLVVGGGGNDGGPACGEMADCERGGGSAGPQGWQLTCRARGCHGPRPRVPGVSLDIPIHA